MADRVPADAPPTVAPPSIEASATAPIATPTLFGSKALHRTLVAFTYRDFRVQWFGACTSSIGTWVQMAAQNWMVQQLTHSPFYLGLDAFLQQLPIMLFTLIGGVVADRYDRRRTLLASQYLQMATAFTLAALVYFDLVLIWHILALSFITGLAQSFGGPAYQSLVPSLVDKKDLPNAVALNSIQFNIARVLGPLITGATLTTFAVWGVKDQQAMSVCFALNGFSFLVVISTLLSLRVKHIAPVAPGTMRNELQGGLKYVRHHSGLVELIVLAALTTFLGFAVLTFLPTLTQTVFHADVATYTHLLAFSGAGSVVGALFVAWLGRFKHMGWTALMVQAVYGVLIILFAQSRVLWLSDLLLFLTGAALMIVFSTITSMVQLIAPNEMRGRVMSIYMVAFRGGMPLGSLASGTLAAWIAPPLVISINGALLVVVALYFLMRKTVVRSM